MRNAINYEASNYYAFMRVFPALKAQQIIPEYAEIDTHFVRIALNAYLHCVYGRKDGYTEEPARIALKEEE